MKLALHAVLVAAIAGHPTELSAEPANLAIRQVGATVELAVTDPANGLWILQGARELGNWEDFKQVQIRNTRMAAGTIPIAPTGTGYRFFRLRPSSSQPNRSTAGMLTLQETPHHYDDAASAPAVFGRIMPRVNIDNNKATLGRVLFYDKRLSANHSVSCASCHQQQHAFADSDRFSTGHNGVLTERNTSSLLGLRTYNGKSGLFSDGRSPDLQSAVGEPILHPEEMGSSEVELLEKIRSEPYYSTLFQAAYPGEPLTFLQIRIALEQFILSLPSFSSKYDKARISGSFETFSPSELAGKLLYETHCISCHNKDTFTSSGFLSNGLDLEPTDPGRQAVTGLEHHRGKFRPPSLRDISITAPYMHDGRFATLREVLEFYNSGVQLHRNLSKPLDGAPLNLSDSQLSDLEAFLGTLTDIEASTNPAFSDPFRSDIGEAP